MDYGHRKKHCNDKETQKEHGGVPVVVSKKVGAY